MSAGHRDLLSSNQHTNGLWLLGGTLRGPGWFQAPSEDHKNQCLAAAGPLQGGEQRRMIQRQSTVEMEQEKVVTELVAVPLPWPQHPSSSSSPAALGEPKWTPQS